MQNKKLQCICILQQSHINMSSVKCHCVKTATSRPIIWNTPTNELSHWHSQLNSRHALQYNADISALGDVAYRRRTVSVVEGQSVSGVEAATTCCCWQPGNYFIAPRWLPAQASNPARIPLPGLGPARPGLARVGPVEPLTLSLTHNRPLPWLSHCTAM